MIELRCMKCTDLLDSVEKIGFKNPRIMCLDCYNKETGTCKPSESLPKVKIAVDPYDCIGENNDE